MRQYLPLETILRLEDRTAVAENRRFRHHSRHHLLRRIGGDLDDRSLEEELLGPQVGDDVLHGQLELLDGEGAGRVQADEGAAGADELLERGQILLRQTVGVFRTDLSCRSTGAASAAAAPD